MAAPIPGDVGLAAAGAAIVAVAEAAVAHGDPSARPSTSTSPCPTGSAAPTGSVGPAEPADPAQPLAPDDGWFDALVATARSVAAGLARAPGPHDLGAVYESLLPSAARDAGVHYTDPGLARALVDRAAPAGWLAGRPRRVWDPACGGGAFLLAAADALVEAGHRPEVILAELLHGTDVDPGAVSVARAALRWWSRRHGVEAAQRDHLHVADALLASDDEVGAPFDLIVGNPPFQGQLAGASVRDQASMARLRDRWGDVVAAYTDTAALFLVAGARALDDDGRLCLVLPLSTLAARDAGPARRAVEEVAELTGLWVAGEAVFAAEVEVCAPVLRRRPPATAGGERTVRVGPQPVERWTGRSVRPVAAPPAPFGSSGLSGSSGSSEASGSSGLSGSSGSSEASGSSVASDRVDPATCAPSDAARRPGHTSSGAQLSEVVAARGGSTWAVHAMDALGVPDPLIRPGGVLAEVVRAAAGFRDEFYGLVGHVVEAPAELDGLEPADDGWPTHVAAVVTCGAIDPGRTSWGRRDIRFAGDRFRRPVLDRGAVDPAGRAGAWVRATAIPKVVVATQTRVGEAAVDERGTLLPSTPVVAAFASPARLWAVAAVICSPVGSVAALARTAGTGRSAQAVRHTTASVGDLPLPVDPDAWRAGADSLRDGDRDRFVESMAAAYAVGPTDAARLAAWWTPRAPWPTPGRPDEP